MPRLPSWDYVAHLYRTVVDDVIPRLQAMAENENLRSLRRFERDEPPEYASSTDDEYLDIHVIPPSPPTPLQPQELKALLDRPFSQQELRSVSSLIRTLARPDHVYHDEVYREHARFQDSYWDRGGPRPVMFRRLDGIMREGVIARHLVKRRWEKLGVWNPKWGFAGRNMHPSDDFKSWTWWWQPEGWADHTGDDFATSPWRTLVARAVQLRQNLHRGERAPLTPRSSLTLEATAAEAEVFFFSRPWFVFAVEVAEECVRLDRLPDHERGRLPPATNQVVKWWTERGDWRDGLDKSWKWPHESPSPEPEDLAPAEAMKDSPLDVAEEMEFTPSEIDELETIDLPRSERPKGSWVRRGSDYITMLFPGVHVDAAAESAKRQRRDDERIEKLKAAGLYIAPPPKSPDVRNIFGAFAFECGKSDESRQAGVLDALSRESSPDPKEDTNRSPPSTQGRLRQPQDRVDNVQGRDLLPTPTPPPRRSARIAAKRAGEPLPSQAEPNKRPRRVAHRAAQPATSPAATATSTPSCSHKSKKTRPDSAGSPLNGRVRARPGKGRSRPKKEKGPNMHSAAAGKKEPACADTKTRRTNLPGAASKGARGGPRRRGRPKKDS